jgi:hypothetical protein
MNTKTKTSKKPVVKVNFSNITDINQISAEITLAKINAGVPITYNDLNNFVEYSIDGFVADLYNEGIIELQKSENLGTVITPKSVYFNLQDFFDKECIPVEKKPNIFKRFWNWITGRK